MGLSEMDGYVVEKESKNWVIAGIALRAPLKPIFTTPPVAKNNDDIHHQEEEKGGEQESCTTPTSQESRIPSRLTCPPAPKKRKPSSRSCNFSGAVREFFIPPHDLEAVFIRRTGKA